MTESQPHRIGAAAKFAVDEQPTIAAVDRRFLEWELDAPWGQRDPQPDHCAASVASL